MPVNRRKLNGLCLSTGHSKEFLDYIDSLEARIDALNERVAVVEFSSPGVFSTLGVVSGGDTVPAGTLEPANAGVVVIDPGVQTWVRISGVEARVGDAVFHTFGGSFVSFPDNPANRRDTAHVVEDGTIQLDISSTNPDLSPSSWLVVKKPVV